MVDELNRDIDLLCARILPGRILRAGMRGLPPDGSAGFEGMLGVLVAGCAGPAGRFRGDSVADTRSCMQREASALDACLSCMTWLMGRGPMEIILHLSASMSTEPERESGSRVRP